MADKLLPVFIKWLEKNGFEPDADGWDKDRVVDALSYFTRKSFEPSPLDEARVLIEKAQEAMWKAAPHSGTAGAYNETLIAIELWLTANPKRELE